MSKTMSSRERVLATLGRKPPDRPAAPHLDADDESLERRDEWGVTHRWVRFGAGRYEEVARQTEWVCMLSFISIFEVYCALKPMDEALMDLYLNPDFEPIPRSMTGDVTPFITQTARPSTLLPTWWGSVSMC